MAELHYDRATYERCAKRGNQMALDVLFLMKENAAFQRLKMIRAIAESMKSGNPHYSISDILTVLDATDLPDRPCQNCDAPYLRGDGVFCEGCGSRIPHPFDLRPERTEKRRLAAHG